MCGSTPEGDPELGDKDSRDGIFYCHAYSILAAYEVNI